MIPFSAMMGLGLLAIALGSRGGTWADAAVVCVLGAFVLFWLGFRWMKRPPTWLQPQWRLAADRGEALPGERRLEPQSRDLDDARAVASSVPPSRRRNRD